MAEQQLEEVLTKYEEHLSVYGVPMRFTVRGVIPSGEQAARHVLWMCAEVRTFLKEGRREKADRWLGFVQGVLWSLGHYTIDDMRSQSRRIEP